MTITRDRVSSAVSNLALSGVMLLIFGCGYAEYETRLGESKKYYAYLDRIEQSLAPKWSLTGNLMELRVPKQFAQIPPAPPVKTEDGKLEPAAIDPRQPDYLNLQLPGMFGAWESPLQIAKGGGTTETRKGYIYALSNYWEFAGENATDAPAFVETLKAQLAENLKIVPVDDQPQTHPKVMPAYQPQLTYNVCNFKGKNINGTNYTFEVYSRNQGSIIGVLVVALPEGIDMQQKINERIPMMLESFNFTSAPPKPGAGNAPAGGNPAAKKANF